MDNLSLKRKKRTGFTLVELLVVIAILAVLASVSVIGYLSFVKKARVSNDVSLTTQMNTVLASNEVVDGKNATPYDAISELDEDGGFDVNKISPTANGYFFGFDTTDNRMVLFDEGMNVVAPEGKSVSDHKRDVFLLVGSESELKTKTEYSYYLKDNFVDKEGDNTINVYTGVDTGTNEIGTVNYTNTSSAQSVLIRTGSYNITLNIYAPNDTVKHYDVAGMVNVRGIATSSYHEHGNVAAMEINGGHVVIEEKGVVDLMYMNPKAYTVDTSSGKIKEDASGTKLIATSVTNNGDIDHAHASSKEEAVNQNGTEGTAGKSTGVIFDYNNNTEQNAVDDVWHHVGDNGGVTGSGKVTDTEEWAGDEKVQSQKTDTAKEFQFNLPEKLTIGDGETEYFKNGEKYTFTSSDETVASVVNGVLTANGEGEATITANGKTCVVTVTRFHGGNGVNTDPYQIMNVKQFNNIGYGKEDINYYILLDDIKLTTSRWYDRYVYMIDFNMNGHTIFASSGAVFLFDKYVKLYNGIFNLSNTASVLYDYASYDGEAYIDNIKLYGNVNVTGWYGPLANIIGNCQNKTQTTKVSITNTHSYVNIKSTSYVGGLLGYCRNIYLDMNNCTVNGRIEAVNESGGFVPGSQYQVVGCDQTNNRGIGTITNCKFNGTLILPTNGTGYYFGVNITNDDDFRGTTGKICKTIDISNDIVISENFGDEIKINYTNTDYKKISVEFAFNVNSTKYGAGGYPRTMTSDIDCASKTLNDILSTGLYKYYIEDGTYGSGDKKSDTNENIFTRGENPTYYYDGNEEYIVSREKGTITVSIRIFAYDLSGDLIAVGSASYLGNK